LAILRSVQGAVRAQPGCIACQVCEEQGTEPAAVLLERWESEEALRGHLRSTVYEDIERALALADHPPDVRFERVMSSEGMELIERERGYR
jgi:quinol monooxygenase YgiN